MTTVEEMRGTIQSIADISNYIRGGRGRFTMESQVTGKRLTYQVHSPKKQYVLKDRPLWITFLNGQNEYQFLGTIWVNSLSNLMTFALGKNSKLTLESPCVKGITWLIGRINIKRELPKEMLFWHEGICCRCGRPLTVPESILRGMGPFCSTM